jgi:hypothetical protein
MFKYTLANIPQNTTHVIADIPSYEKAVDTLQMVIQDNQSNIKEVSIGLDRISLKWKVIYILYHDKILTKLKNMRSPDEPTA